ncbi:MAG: C40 family peptidase [Gammaproteobacteria bacterium]
MKTEQYGCTRLRLFCLLLASVSISLQLSSCATQPASIGFGTIISETTPEGRLRMEILRTAQSMLGKPYHYGGSTPRGFDCSGLVFYSYKKAGITVPRTSRAQYQRTKPLATAKLLPGDVLFFSIGGDISHVGIYQGDNVFIHAPVSGKQVTRDSMTSRYWNSHFVRGGRLL